METIKIAEVVEDLNDLELAVLVCLVADQHCIIRAAEGQLSDIEGELELICSKTFGLTFAALRCSDHTTLADVSDTVVLKDANVAFNGEVQDYPSNARGHSRMSRTASDDRPPNRKRPSNVLDNRKVAHVIVATNLEQTSRNVQIQALELMRSRRIFSRTAVHATPKRFLFIALQSTSAPGPPHYTPFLNDSFFISHTILPYQHVPRVASTQRPSSLSSQASGVSVVRKSPKTVAIGPKITESNLVILQALTDEVQMTAEIRRHIHNVVTFLRLHRHVFNGVSSVASRQFNLLSRVLAPLHNLAYVTPSLVALAARKIYPHRIEVVSGPAQERSMQWGSDSDAVEQAIIGVTAESVVEDVLEEVECPV